MKTSIFKAEVGTPFGSFQVAVKSIKQDAKKDIHNAVSSELNAPHLITVNEVKRSNRSILTKMTPIKKADSYIDGQWAWMKRIK